MTLAEYYESQRMEHDRLESHDPNTCPHCGKPTTFNALVGTQEQRPSGCYYIRYRCCDECHMQRVSPPYLTPDL